MCNIYVYWTYHLYMKLCRSLSNKKENINGAAEIKVLKHGRTVRDVKDVWPHIRGHSYFVFWASCPYICMYIQIKLKQQLV